MKTLSIITLFTLLAKDTHERKGSEQTPVTSASSDGWWFLVGWVLQTRWVMVITRFSGGVFIGYVAGDLYSNNVDLKIIGGNSFAL
ncbi:hypothetical protein HanPI659440_Chr07g0274271 [Helianthus annuus]|nr:hypothetical protein HanPI659440_Chr07g0274271 [Helianthus annuus]